MPFMPYGHMDIWMDIVDGHRKTLLGMGKSVLNKSLIIFYAIWTEWMDICFMSYEHNVWTYGKITFSKSLSESERLS